MKQQQNEINKQFDIYIWKIKLPNKPIDSDKIFNDFKESKIKPIRDALANDKKYKYDGNKYQNKMVLKQF